MAQFFDSLTHGNHIIRISTVEVGYPNRGWQRFLTLESFVEALTKVCLHTQSLQDKHAHPHKSLLSGVISLVDGVVEHKHHKVMRPVRINYKGAEALVTLESLPK